MYILPTFLLTKYTHFYKENKKVLSLLHTLYV